jgi:hypothetical protein
MKRKWESRVRIPKLSLEVAKAIGVKSHNKPGIPVAIYDIHIL